MYHKTEEFLKVLDQFVGSYIQHSQNPKRAMHLMNRFFKIEDIYFHMELKKQQNDMMRCVEESAIKWSIHNHTTVYINQLQLEAQHFQKSIVDLLKNMEVSNVKVAVLDLRNNCGGKLENALLFLGAFDSKHNVNIIMDDKSKEKILLNTVQKQQINLDILKWIILVNRNTISAAELIALALKEEKKALLIGEKTYGKSEIQKNMVMENIIVKFTVGKFFFKNIDISNRGIQPDIEISNVGLDLYNQYKKIKSGIAQYTEYVIFVQTVLKKLGMYDGKITGIYDIETINRVKEYRRIKEIKETDFITDTLLEALYFDLEQVTDHQMAKVEEIVMGCEK